MLVAVPSQGDASIPGYLPLAPAFNFYEQAIQGCLVNVQVFLILGAGYYRYRAAQLEFFAPGWRDGYTDHDVQRTPRMVRVK